MRSLSQIATAIVLLFSLDVFAQTPPVFMNTSPYGPFPLTSTAPRDAFGRSPISVPSSAFGINFVEICSPILNPSLDQIASSLQEKCEQVNQINGSPGGFITYWMQPNLMPHVACMRVDGVYQVAGICPQLVPHPDFRILRLSLEQPEGVPVVPDMNGQYTLRSGAAVVARVDVFATGLSEHHRGLINLQWDIDYSFFNVDRFDIEEIRNQTVQKSFTFTPSSTGGHTLRVQINTGGLKESNYNDNLLSRFYTVQEQEALKLSINQMRFGQTVFNPKLRFEDSNLALVSNKTFAAEVTLSADVPSQYIDAEAVGELLVGQTVVGISQPFKISSIISGTSKLFLFGRTPVTGLNDVSVRLKLPAELVNQVDPASVLSSTASAMFYQTQLSILTGEISGCAIGYTCMVPIDASDRTKSKEQFDYAQKLLPISDGGITTMQGSPLNDQRMVKFVAPFVHAMQIWMQKRKLKVQQAAFLVSREYFQHTWYEPESRVNYGLNIGGIVLYDSRSKFSLTHELLHSYVGGHKGEQNIEGIYADEKVAFTNGRAIFGSGGQINGPTSINIFRKNTESFGLIDYPSYTGVFNGLLAEKVDPPVFLVAGVVNGAGQTVWSDAQQADVDLEPTANSELTFKGYDSSGREVSSAPGSLIRNAVGFGEDGPIIYESENYAFQGVLPDTGNITTIRVLKNGAVIKEIKTRISLAEVISALTTSAFRNPKLAKGKLTLIQTQFKTYLQLSQKKNKLAAKVILALLRITIDEFLSESFMLKTGETITKVQLLKLIDEEMKK